MMVSLVEDHQGITALVVLRRTSGEGLTSESIVDGSRMLTHSTTHWSLSHPAATVLGGHGTSASGPGQSFILTDTQRSGGCPVGDGGCKSDRGLTLDL